jgi:hypothetical protein
MEAITKIQKIKNFLIKNNGKWDLTNDKGESIIYDEEKDLPITDIVAGETGEPCVLVPLSHFCDETIEEIYNIM